jgi:hypothetical protein
VDWWCEQLHFQVTTKLPVLPAAERAAATDRISRIDSSNNNDSKVNSV